MTQKKWIVFAIALFGLALFSISTALADSSEDDDNELTAYGHIVSFPESLIGEWVIDGLTVTANPSTEFEQEEGDFAVGQCVAVEYDATTLIASEIKTEDDDDACSNLPTDDVTLYGNIASFPESLIGEWVIDGLTVTANASTEFEQEEGDFAVGRCVSVEYDTTTFIASEIETEEAYKCNGSDFTNTAYGTVEVVPASGYGQWTISGVVYVATAGETELEEGAESASVGDCVEVEYYSANGVNRATEIDLEEDDDDCSDLPTNDDDDRNVSKIFATITELPNAPYAGMWRIGGILFEANSATEFDQDNGAFAVGRCVEAEYIIVSGNKLLVEVETESAYKCERGADDDESSSYGTIESLPSSADLTGEWVVSGIRYIVDGNTDLEEEYGLFTVGAYVEVYFIVNGMGNVAAEIETHVAPGSGANDGVGEVENYDPTDDWADWTIDGVVYKADPAIEANDLQSASGRGQNSSLIGQTVIFNSYQQNGVNYLTAVSVAEQLFLPTVTR